MGRAYTQTNRAASTEQTRRAILQAAIRRFYLGDYETNLEAVAEEAGVSTRTVLRHFGSKDALLEAALLAAAEDVRERRRAPTGDVAAFTTALVDHYEADGDAVLRSLAAEERFPLVQRVNEGGRRLHAEMVEEAFARDLDGLDGETRAERMALLVAVTDVHTWALLRRRGGLDRAATERAVRGLIDHARGEER